MEQIDDQNPSFQKEFQHQWEILTNGISEITPMDEFKTMLKKSLLTNTPLRVKCGIDPTLSEIHLGHLVPFKKMRDFQNLGHKGVVIFGDYTAQIGDPSGKSDSRPSLDNQTVKKNVESFLEQISTVIDPKSVEIHYQSEWFEKVQLKDILSWCMETTVAKLLSHETFANRVQEGRSLGLHEFMYPVLQGIDSVYVQSDVELGGTDQKFNVLMGRDYQKNRSMRPQVAMLLPIIRGTCGIQKMSKSLNNFIGVRDIPKDKFGKIMRIPDELMEEYFRYLLGITNKKWQELAMGLKDESIHPNNLKKDLAQEVVSFFHGQGAGLLERKEFESIFAKGQKPQDTPIIDFVNGSILLDLLFDNKIIETKSEGRRLFTQNAVSILQGDKLTNPLISLDNSFHDKTLKLGKRKFITLRFVNDK